MARFAMPSQPPLGGSRKPATAVNRAARCETSSDRTTWRRPTRVQETLTRTRLSRGARAVGRKIGLTSPAVQPQLGVDQPDFGVLFDDMDVRRRRSHRHAPAAPAEGRGRGRVRPRRRPRRRPARRARRSAPRSSTRVAALEIVDSRIADWDITFADTVADNASSGLYVLGDRLRRPSTSSSPSTSTMTHDRRRRGGLHRQRRRLPRRPARRAGLARPHRPRARRAAARRPGHPLRRPRPDGARRRRRSRHRHRSPGSAPSTAHRLSRERAATHDRRKVADHRLRATSAPT